MTELDKRCARAYLRWMQTRPLSVDTREDFDRNAPRLELRGRDGRVSLSRSPFVIVAA